MKLVENIHVENIVLPNKPLINFELMEAVKKLKTKKFWGIFLRYTLLVKPRKIECAIMNLDSSSSGKNGTHWVCFFKRGNDKCSFGSFGLPPPTELDTYLEGSVFEQIQPKQ